MSDNTKNGVQEEVGFDKHEIKTELVDIKRGMADMEQRIDKISTLFDGLGSTQDKHGEDISDMKVDIKEVANNVQELKLKTDMHEISIANNTKTCERISNHLGVIERENIRAMQGVTGALNALTEKIHTEEVKRMEKDHEQDMKGQQAIAELKDMISSNKKSVSSGKKAKSSTSFLDLMKTIVTTPWFTVVALSLLAASGIALQFMK